MTITVKVSSRGAGPSPDVSQYLGNAQGRWEDVEFHINTPIDRADVWFVMEDLDAEESCWVPGGNVVFLTAETSWDADWYVGSAPGRRFLSQFDHVFTPHAAYFESTSNTTVHQAMPFLPWMINANHGASINRAHERDVHWLSRMEMPAKLKTLSVICSAQSRTPSHRMRLAFVEALKEHFGDRLDWFGNGVNPIDEKWDALAPYRYSIALENQVLPNLITEKLLDCFLTWTHPIYSGAPNVGDYFPKGSFTPVDMRNLSRSIDIIEEVLEAPRGNEHEQALEEARGRVLTSLHPYERMSRIATQLTTDASASLNRLLRPLGSYEQAAGAKSLSRKLGESFNKVGDKLVRRSLRE